ncbi:hypothetical protein [Burkholderia sp. AU31652]|uniref:hypothetical protein n=1 Tax=Burkholderia sp. AU31652 TaxID=2015354 RepID=UPI0011779259|nr:hypothetical protein [Burkholderia sp. AU31652]
MMKNIKSSFAALVRKGSVKSPTDRNFSEKAWNAAWKASADNEVADEQLYNAGIVFSRILAELRGEIDHLYRKPPNVGWLDLIKAYCGMANRDAFIVSKSHSQPRGDLTALTSSRNRMGNKLTLSEIATGCVDGIDIAIRNLMRTRVRAEFGKNSVDAFDFVKKEIAISQLYGIYEGYWRALLWGECEFEHKSAMEYEVKQKASDFYIAYEISQLRKDKLMANAVPFATDPAYLAMLGSKLCLDFVRSGKRRSISVIEAGKLSENYQVFHAMYFYQLIQLEDCFPRGFLENEYNNQGFSVLDVLEVFRLLVILAQVSLDNFPSNDGVFTFNKAVKFSPSVNRSELLRGVSKITGWKFEKSEKILDFLSFNGDREKDLWCYPVVDIGEGNVTYLVAALVSPVLQRVVEHWLVKMKVDLAEKGRSFEGVVTAVLNETIKGNPLFSDHDPVVGRRVDLDASGGEEIDLLLRFGSVVVVGEIKSIVTTDSPISLYRTRQIISGASEQAKRKSGYFKNNLEAAFRELGWNFDPNEAYRIVPVIVLSSGICAGLTMNDVPVCDLRILSKYFKNNIVPLVSVSEKEHLVWFKLYENFVDAQENFEKYLHHPPQIAQSERDFEGVTFRVPCVSEDSAKIVFTRLVKKPVDVDQLLKRQFPFPLHRSDGFAEVIAKADAFL